MDTTRQGGFVCTAAGRTGQDFTRNHCIPYLDVLEGPSVNDHSVCFQYLGKQKTVGCCQNYCRHVAAGQLERLCQLLHYEQHLLTWDHPPL